MNKPQIEKLNESPKEMGMFPNAKNADELNWNIMATQINKIRVKTNELITAFNLLGQEKETKPSEKPRAKVWCDKCGKLIGIAGHAYLAESICSCTTSSKSEGWEKEFDRKWKILRPLYELPPDQTLAFNQHERKLGEIKEFICNLLSTARTEERERIVGIISGIEYEYKKVPPPTNDMSPTEFGDNMTQALTNVVTVEIIENIKLNIINSISK